MLESVIDREVGSWLMSGLVITNCGQYIRTLSFSAIHFNCSLLYSALCDASATGNYQ
jgi:hypothetical protein